jgi:SSS family solute:Na+ symporter
MIVYPTLDDIARAFPYLDRSLIGHDMAYPAMLTFLPSGLLGLMIAGLLAAYVSTLSTHLNWGTSYLVHDLYRRFGRTGADETHYVFVGRIVTGLLMVLAAALTFVLDSARQSFELMMSIGAGTGLIYLLRWYWWRINAWSEIAAMISSFVVTVYFFVASKRGQPVPAHIALLITVGVTTVVWLVTTLLTAPSDRATLVRFYELVRPAGPGWKDIRDESKLPPSPDSIPQMMLGWVLGCAFIYAALFGTGSFLYGKTAQALVWLVVFLVSGTGLLRMLPRLWARESDERAR